MLKKLLGKTSSFAFKISFSFTTVLNSGELYLLGCLKIQDPI